MSSIILHLAISKHLKEKNNLSNEFLVGAVAPDIYKKTIENRDITHYIKVYKNDNGTIKRLPDIDKFLEDHKEKTSEFFIGYLVHLMQDKVWFNEYIPLYADKLSEEEVRYTEDNSKHSNKEFSKEIYLDYAVADRFILSKVDLDLQEIREIAKKHFNNEETSQIIENEVRLFDKKEGRNNRFLTDDITLRYFNQCVEECNKAIETIKFKM